MLTAGLLTGQDTLRDALHQLTPGQDAYGSYVDNFGGFPELLAMRDKLNPHAVYFSYTIFGNRAHFADVEPGAMSASSFAHWLSSGQGIVLPGNKVPGMYTSAGNADAVFSAVGLGGLPHDQLPDKFVFQSAHYGAGPHICAPSTCGFRAAHGTQWADKGPNGENVDRALWHPGALGAHPLPPLPEGTMGISVFKNENGHSEIVVHLATGEVKNLYKAKDDKTGAVAWKRKPDGSFAWESLGNPGK